MTSLTIFRSAVIDVRKKAENAASDSFRSNFSGTAICLAQPIGGLLVANQKFAPLPVDTSVATSAIIWS